MHGVYRTPADLPTTQIGPAEDFLNLLRGDRSVRSRAALGRQIRQLRDSGWTWQLILSVAEEVEKTSRPTMYAWMDLADSDDLEERIEYEERPQSTVCTASGMTRAFTPDELGKGRGVCHDCGVDVPLWIRANDSINTARVRRHLTPPGVEPVTRWASRAELE